MPGFLRSPPRPPPRPRRFAPRSPQRAVRFALRFALLEDDDGGSYADRLPVEQTDVPAFEDVGNAPGVEDGHGTEAEALKIEEAARGCDDGGSNEMCDDGMGGGTLGIASCNWDAALRRYERETGALDDDAEDPAIVSYDESDAGSSSDESRADSLEEVDAVENADRAPLHQSQARSYPILAPAIAHTNNRGTNKQHIVQHDSEFELFSLQVEMAKSAFLRDPCEARWRDLVHSFQVEMLRRLEREDVEKTVEDEFEANVRSGMAVGEDGDATSEECDDPHQAGSAEFGESGMHRQSSGGKGKLETASVGAPRSSSEPATQNMSVDVAPAQARHEDRTASPKKKALHLLDDDSTSFADFGDDEDCWVERDVSPMSLQRKGISMAISLSSSEDEAKVKAPAHCDDVSKGASKRITTKANAQRERATKAATKKRPFEPSSSARTTSNKVLHEVLHWEKRIERYDQRYVAIVAAALDEARGAAWKEGQVLEVVPSALVGRGGAEGGSWEGLEGAADEEILYVV